MLTSRMGDLGVGYCPIHKTGTAGMIISGASTKFSAGPPSARVCDMLICFCGCPSMIVQGSPNAFDEGLNCARTGDTISAVVTGSLISGTGAHITGG